MKIRPQEVPMNSVEKSGAIYWMPAVLPRHYLNITSLYAHFIKTKFLF